MQQTLTEGILCLQVAFAESHLFVKQFKQCVRCECIDCWTLSVPFLAARSCQRHSASNNL
jgi:hypothetical protein